MKRIYVDDYPSFINPRAFTGLLGDTVREKEQCLREAQKYEQEIQSAITQLLGTMNRTRLEDLAQRKAGAWVAIRRAKAELIRARTLAIELERKSSRRKER